MERIYRPFKRQKIEPQFLDVLGLDFEDVAQPNEILDSFTRRKNYGKRTYNLSVKLKQGRVKVTQPNDTISVTRTIETVTRA